MNGAAAVCVRPPVAEGHPQQPDICIGLMPIRKVTGVGVKSNP